MSFYVFDLDGTLALMAHRRHLLPDWKAFHAAIVDDEPNWPVVDLLINLISDGHRCEIWSGRDEEERVATLAFLKDKCSIPLDKVLVRLRPIGDDRPDEIMKEDWLADAVPDMIFDDRQKVVDMWRSRGITVAQVAPGDFDSIIRPNNSIVFGEEPILVLMIGPSGAGKSTWLRRSIEEWEDTDDPGYDPTCIISTDSIRANLCEDFKSQQRNKDVSKIVMTLLKARMQCGLRTIVDATNLEAHWRKKMVGLVPEGMQVLYLVINRENELGWRDPEVVKTYVKQFRQQLPNILKGDGLANVRVRAATYDEQDNPITDAIAPAV